MKSITLFRHGDTEEIGADSDYSRKLTDEGILRSGEIAEHLKNSGLKIDLIITSGALRANATASIIAGKTGYFESDILIDDILYSSKKVTDLIPLIRNLSENISSVMFVGHIPLLNDLASYMNSSPREINLKKSAAIKLNFDADKWDAVEQGTGRIEFFKLFENGIICDAADKFI